MPAAGGGGIGGVGGGGIGGVRWRRWCAVNQTASQNHEAGLSQAKAFFVAQSSRRGWLGFRQVVPARRFLIVRDHVGGRGRNRKDSVAWGHPRFDLACRGHPLLGEIC